MNIASLGDCIGVLYGKIPKHIKVILGATLVFGLLAHMFALTNKFINHDDIYYMFQSVQNDGVYRMSGRWFMRFAGDFLSGAYGMPWLKGLVTLFFVAISNCFIAECWKIRGTTACVILSGITAAFPILPALFHFTFMFSGYGLALLLVCAAGYLGNRWKWLGALGAIICITLSMGIYQSYFSFAAGLFVGIIILDILENEMSVKQITLKGVRFVAILILSMAAYFLIVKITTAETGLNTYRDIDKMGQINISELPNMIWNAYTSAYEFFMRQVFTPNSSIMPYLFRIIAVAALGLTVIFVVRRKIYKNWVKCAMLIMLLALFPLSANITHFFGVSGGVSYLMMHSLVLLPLSVIALIESATARDSKIFRGIDWVIYICFICIITGYVQYDNQVYFREYINVEQTVSYYNRLLVRIESLQGYTYDMPIRIIGNTFSSYVDPTPALQTVHSPAALRKSQALNPMYSTGYLLRSLLYSAAMDIQLISLADTAQLSEWSEIQNMPIYPSDQSVRIMNGIAYVKIEG